MQILLFSDTHGEVLRSIAMLQAHPEVDVCLHLGDVGFDHSILGHIPIVNGNHDHHAYPMQREMQFGAFRTLALHGHQFESMMFEHLRESPYLNQNLDNCMTLLYDEMVSYAKRHSYDMILFGHTHIAYFEKRDGIYLCNPGSLCYSHDGRPPSYAILSVEEKITATFYFSTETG